MKNDRKWFIEIGVGFENNLRGLIETGWCGIMVEPQQSALDNIEPHKNLFMECVAISTSEGLENFFIVQDLEIFDEPLVVAGMFGLEQSPNAIHHKSYDEYRKIIQVNTIKLDNLIKKYHLIEIDLLKIDVEGFEVPILLDYSFVIKPKMIKFEHVHYSGKIYDATVGGFDQKKMKDDYNILIEKLSDMGYIVWEEEQDVYCVR
jgi:FkbM family methyltransferase